ncbi:thiamine-phosphate kinase [Crenobacter intestini]|uniref:Thiamine-monophosphate kinase n=1 Tax=Crenobacter intestini TaxID=2563443 RepID=A0A4T0V5E8_9NEIS|nr:thiamine-phosphate kinase [Crenobacter intestini]TIC86968.1 thiamine-phosphate kinase [Crenobacter intestini]
MNEFQLIRRYFDRPAPGAVLGVGDDAAILAPAPGMELVVTTDMLVEGRHFFAGTDPASLGHKTLAVNLSDVAAMGARARWATLAVALPAADEAWLAAFSRGFFSLADRHDVDLVGGDTTRGPLTLSVTLIGEVPAGQAIRRDGAVAGDDIWVSGELGGAALAVAARYGRAPDVGLDTLRNAARRLDWPEPRLQLGERLRGLASAALDVSDGLTGDLAHLCERSGVAAELWLSALPCAEALLALRSSAPALFAAGGDDYELCFTAPRAHRAAIEALPAELGLRLTRVGRVAAGEGVRLLDAPDGAPVLLTHTSYDHFR